MLVRQTMNQLIFLYSQIRDGLERKMFHGTRFPPSYTSQTEKLQLTFTADRLSSKKGFNISYESKLSISC